MIPPIAAVSSKPPYQTMHHKRGFEIASILLLSILLIKCQKFRLISRAKFSMMIANQYWNKEAFKMNFVANFKKLTGGG